MNQTSKSCNGIMFMKERKLDELEKLNVQLMEELRNLERIYAGHMNNQNQLRKQIIPLHNELNMVEIEILEHQNKLNGYHKQIQNLKSQETSLNEVANRLNLEVINAQKQLSILREELEDKSRFLKRLTKENELNKKMGSLRSHLNQERDKYDKLIKKDEREIEVLKNSLKSKAKFMNILEKKGEELQKTASKREIAEKIIKKQDFQDTIKSIQTLKIQKMKSLERIIRNKNAVLMKRK